MWPKRWCAPGNSGMFLVGEVRYMVAGVLHSILGHGRIKFEINGMVFLGEVAFTV
jgi:hypothetical protein